jgi:hypothetical protein
VTDTYRRPKSAAWALDKTALLDTLLCGLPEHASAVPRDFSWYFVIGGSLQGLVALSAYRPVNTCAPTDMAREFSGASGCG